MSAALKSVCVAVITHLVFSLSHVSRLHKHRNTKIMAHKDKDEEICEDKNPDRCKNFAFFCSTRTKFMSKNCKLTCNMCSIGDPNEHMDLSSKCATVLAKYGQSYCLKRDWSSICAYSCRDFLCEDKKPDECKARVSDGDCLSKHIDMSKYCKLSCSMCVPGSSVMDTTSVCKSKESQCNETEWQEICPHTCGQFTAPPPSEATKPLSPFAPQARNQPQISSGIGPGIPPQQANVATQTGQVPQPYAIPLGTTPQLPNAVPQPVQPSQSNAIAQGVAPQQTNAATGPMQPAQSNAIPQGTTPQQPNAVSQPVQPSQSNAIAQGVAPQQTNAATGPMQPAQSNAIPQGTTPQQPNAVSQPVQPSQSNAIAQGVAPQQTNAATGPMQRAQSNAIPQGTTPQQPNAVSQPVQPSQSNAIAQGVAPQQTNGGATGPLQPTQSNAMPQGTTPQQSNAVPQPVQPSQSNAIAQGVAPQQTNAATGPMQPGQSNAILQGTTPQQPNAASQPVQPSQSNAMTQGVTPQQTNVGAQPVQPLQSSRISTGMGVVSNPPQTNNMLQTSQLSPSCDSVQAQKPMSLNEVGKSKAFTSPNHNSDGERPITNIPMVQPPAAPLQTNNGTAQDAQPLDQETTQISPQRQVTTAQPQLVVFDPTQTQATQHSQLHPNEQSVVTQTQQPLAVTQVQKLQRLPVQSASHVQVLNTALPPRQGTVRPKEQQKVEGVVTGDSSKPQASVFNNKAKSAENIPHTNTRKRKTNSQVKTIGKYLATKTSHSNKKTKKISQLIKQKEMTKFARH
ncbi:glutenin, high molecular weight subunit PW212-like [Acropora millepora]|uniref:glutenin, high molecular weight subunit PW212-like n=1 Tax=Acropora millepora TaxID=45264 RepID=UPI001CF25152|nr:glutenin, high molecular weight subunit PW212-like [Acropora millepora]